MKQNRLTEWIYRRWRRRSDTTSSHGDPAMDMPDIVEGITDTGYFAQISYRYAVAQIIGIMVLAIYLAVSLLTNTALLSADNLIYFAKDLTTSLSDRESEARDTLVYAADEDNTYALYREGLVVLGKQKLTVFTATGREAYSRLISYQTPALATSGRYFMVYDIGGTAFGVYNSFTCVKEQSTQRGIRSAVVCDRGYYCVVTEGQESESEVLLYNERHRLINRYRLREYTIGADFRQDGEELLLISVYTENGSMKTQLTRVVPGENTYGETITVDHAYPIRAQYTEDGNILLLTTDTLYLFSSEGQQLMTYVFFDEQVMRAYADDQGCVLLSRANAYDASLRVKAFDKNGQMMYNVIGTGVLRDVSFHSGCLALLGDGVLTVYRKADGETTEVATVRYNGEYDRVYCISEEEWMLCGEAKAIIVCPEFLYDSGVLDGSEGE